MGKIEEIIRYPVDGLHGRRKIYTDKREITPENVVEVVGKAYGVHLMNVAEENYLIDYYKGKQDIRLKQKYARANINNFVVSNRANQIVTFKTAYLLGEPIKYISAGEDVYDDVSTINKYMRDEDKESKDKELADWLHICGVAPRMILPDESADERYGSPVALYTLDPRKAFVIYYSGLGNKPLAGVILQNDEDGNVYMCVYTDTFYCEINSEGFRVLEASTMFAESFTRPHLMGRIPVIEYVNGDSRMGSFEAVIPLLNAINQIESSRVDGIEDFVNAYDVFQNCEIDEDTYKQLAQGGQAIQISSKVVGSESKVYRICSEMNQGSSQTVIDDLYGTVLEICGMPSMNASGSSGASDNVGAVLYKNGYYSSESRAKDTEKTWIRSEREFLRVLLALCPELNLKVSDIECQFTRKNIDNLQSRVQVLCEMLANDKIDPKMAYEYSGVFIDSNAAYMAGMKYQEEQEKKLSQQLNQFGSANSGYNGNGMQRSVRDGDGDGILNE